MTFAARPIVLCILDGWGQRPQREGNAVLQAHTPCLDQLFTRYPHSLLQASGLAVGLPEGQMGNSEVGHMNIGAGRVVYQDLTRISKSIADGDFFRNPVLLQAMAALRHSGGKLHLLGLLSDGGVHSHDSHLYALIDLARQQGISNIQIHAILDGRDTPPQSAGRYLQALEHHLAGGPGRIASLCGRFYAMDRDQRWDRVERAWRMLVEAEAPCQPDSATALATAYAAGETDEFVTPCLIGTADGRITDGDAVIVFNFRSDRVREISRTFCDPHFTGFAQRYRPQLCRYVCFTEYDETLHLPVAFPPENLHNLLAEVVASAGLRQLHIAETEKYAHVTFFFNGGREEPFRGEERILIPSPQDVTTYDQKPQMSAAQVRDTVCGKIAENCFDLIILNFANPDMVGHTGSLPAAIKAMETVDRCLADVVAVTLQQGGALLITADHGNCEQMIDDQGQPHTAHTTNPVALLYVAGDSDGYRLADGRLADLAPTLLQLLHLPQPAEMTGHSLLQPA